MNFIAKVKENGTKVGKKVLAAVCSASLAASAMAVNVFASEGGSGGLDTSKITDEMKSSLTSLVETAGIACAAVIGVGLSIFAGKWLVTTIKNFFMKVAK